MTIRRLDGGANVATATTNDVESIRRQMAQIRQRLHQDMKGVVAGAEAASDWRHYVRLYPWAALGVAAAAGFLVVPRKKRSVTRTAEEAAEATVERISEAADTLNAKARKAGRAVRETVEPKSETKKKGLIAGAIGLLAPMALRAAQSYAVSYVEGWIAQQQAAAMGAGPGMAPGQSAGPGHPQQPPQSSSGRPGQPPFGYPRPPQ